MPRIRKGSNHSEIIGKHGEYLVCNWLSRSGFEVVYADHTGIDVVACHPDGQVRLGISVKSVTRNRQACNNDNDSVNVFTKDRDRKKILDACTAFGCEPWIAVYAETANGSDLYLTSLANFDHKYHRRDDSPSIDWKMSRVKNAQYLKDPNVKHIHMEFKADHWFPIVEETVDC
jgi:hypothetical protein